MTTDPADINAIEQNLSAMCASEQRFRAIFEQTGMGVILSDPSGNILEANQAFQKMVGYNADELIGMKFVQLTPAEDVEQEIQLVRQLRTQDEPRPAQFEKRYIRKDHRTFWARLTLSFVRNHKGELQFVMAIVEDVTKAKQMQDALRQRDAILESVAYAAEQFLKSSNWRENIQSVLESLGRNTNSSHAYLMENHLGPDGSPVTSMRYEWTAPGDEPELDDPVYQNNPLMEPGLERWHAALSQGKPFYGNLSTFLPEEVKVIAPTGPTSIIEVPIFVQGKWWGLIGFDDIHDERVWTGAEIDAYQAAAAIIGAAITRQAADAALYEKESIVRTLGNNLPNGGIYQLIITPDGDHRFSYMSEGIQEITGLSVEQMLQSPELVTGQILPEDLSRLAEIEQEVNRTEGKASFDVRIRDTNGNIKWCHHSAAARRTGDGSIIWDAILQDITSRKLAEEEIRQLNAELEQRVHQRTIDLQAANQELEAFAFSVSHDLRGPLRHLDGYSKLLLLDYEDRLDSDGKSLLSNIRQSAQQMGQLIDDLLQLSRTTRAEMNPTTVDLSALAKQIILSMQQSEPPDQWM